MRGGRGGMPMNAYRPPAYRPPYGVPNFPQGNMGMPMYNTALP